MKYSKLMAFHTGHHKIFYRIGAGTISIVRILHERMDPGRHVE